MTRQLVPIFALILGSALLMVAGGLHGLILPLRGSEEGFSAFNLGLLGTGWAIGYIGGCIATPRLVRRAGHVRTFAVMAAIAVLSVLIALLLIHPGPWIALRALAGFAFAGAAMIVESWLNESTEFSYRGRVFGVYTMVNLLATTAGQLLVALGDASGFFFFVLAAVFYALSLIPSALTRTAQPRPLVETSLDVGALVRNSPLAVAGVFLVGMSNSTFGTLGVVYGNGIGLDVTAISLMMSLTILAGSAAQVPVGMLSDRIDRRKVLIGLAVVAAVVDLYFLAVRPEAPLVVLAATFVFGGAIYAMYPVIIAHANDHAAPDEFLKISGGLLLVFGVGSIVGPLVGGAAMTFGPVGMFAATFVAHLALALYGAWRMTRREAVPEGDKQAFVGLAPARLATPESVALDPRAEPGEAEQRDRLPGVE
ncbi:MAG: MFS transporter [Alphaproteobacteria bacterium]|nr:MAG: MFS transporter [Alphaproteobacteria bacterium]